MLLKNIKLKSRGPSDNALSAAFETEFKLVDLFEQMIGHQLNANAGLLREFESVDGVADIILFDLYKDYHSNLSIGGINSRCRK